MSSLRLLLPRLSRTSRTFPPIRQFTTSLPALSSFSDPFPLPLSDPDLAALASRSPSPKHDSIEAYVDEMPKPLDRTGESVETMRARLVYQTRKRGTLESDLILSTFARDELGKMGVEELRDFDKLLDEPDWDIYYWSVQKKEPPARWKGTTLLEKLIKHTKNEGKEVRMMPALMHRGLE